MWDIKTGKTLLVYKEHTDYVRCVGIAPDGNTAITSSGDWNSGEARYRMAELYACYYVSTFVFVALLLVQGQWVLGVIV